MMDCYNLTHFIFPGLSSKGCTLVVFGTHAHGCKLTSLLCQSDDIVKFVSQLIQDLLAGLQIRVRIEKLFSLFLIQNICCVY